MKHFAYILTTLCLAGIAAAGPLQKQEVAADAKWLLHIDVDKLRSTPVGDSFVKQVVNRHFEQKMAELKQSGIDLDLSKIHSVTAYGDYTKSNNAVLIKTDLDVQKILETALNQAAKSKGLFEKSSSEGALTYAFPDHSSLCIRPDRIVVYSKSAETTRRANDVISGKAAHLNSSRTFADFPDLKKSFFFLAVAEGFNSTSKFDSESGDDGKNNPKARILKLADSGRVVMGQDGDQVFLNVSLQAKTAEIVTQMQQVVQGMVALASLIHSDSEAVRELADSAKVSTAGNAVILSLNFPADKALLMLNQQLEHRNHEREPRGATNRPSNKTE